jgi:flagellar protein FliS
MQNVPSPRVPEQGLIDRIEGASPAELHAMLLEAGQKFLNLAFLAMQQNDAAGQSRHLGRVSEIIVELSGRLNHEVGGELVANLTRIYDGWIDALFDAGQKHQPERLLVVQRQMGELRATWAELCLNPLGTTRNQMVS